MHDSISRGQSKPCDDFEEMDEIMESVQKKLLLIESGLLSILDSKALFAKRTFLSANNNNEKNDPFMDSRT